MDAPNPNHPTPDTMSAYSLGKLDDTAAEAVHRHLEDCQECQRQVAEMSPDSFLGRLRDAQEGPETSAAGPPVAVVPPAESTVDDGVVVELSVSSYISSTGQIGATSDALNSPADTSLPAGTRIGYFGDYELLKVVGEGGMGIVYKARQLSLNRPVALKMIKTARFPSPDEVRRFQNESEAVARLDHPNIVPVYEVGQYEDQHYFSMKLIAGESLDKRSKDYLSDPRRAAELLVTASGAIHHAHQRGILHRDLKPANILIDSEGRPHVTDFGLAKRVEGDSELTRSGAILGTPAYMAPEQASGKRGAVTTATDVYGLGAVLYVLLTGRAPFSGDSMIDTLEQVRKQPPEPPSKRNPRVPRDLEVICLKCLEKDPRRRYASADAIAGDLKHWIVGEPITARPVGNAASFWMWCRRNPIVAGASGLVAVALVVVTVLALLYADRKARLATSESLRADEQAHHSSEQAKAAANLKDALTQSNRRLALLNLERGRAACDQGQISSGLLWMLESLRVATDASDPDWKNAALANLAAWRACYNGLRGVYSNDRNVTTFALSPDGKKILMGSGDNTARLWDVATGKLIAPPLQHQALIHSAAFSPDGKTILTEGGTTARLWDTASGIPIGQPMEHQDRIRAAAYSPDGKTVLTGSWDKTARLWDVATGLPFGKPMEHQRGVYDVAYSPDGRTVLTGGQDGAVRLWDASTGLPFGKPMEHQDEVNVVAYSPDGRTVLTGGQDGAVRLWDASTGLPIGKPMTHQLGILVATFSPNGKTIFAASQDRTAQLWDAATGLAIGNPIRHAGYARSVAFSPDSKTLVTGSADRALTASEDGSVRLWDAATGLPLAKLLDYQSGVYGVDFVAFSPDGETVLIGSSAGRAWLWDLAARPQIRKCLNHEHPSVTSVAFSPDGKTILTRNGDGRAQLWDVATGLSFGKPMGHQGVILVATYSPDGRTVFTGGMDKTARLWDAATGLPIGKPIEYQAWITAVAFSPDGKTVLTGSLLDNTVRLWNVATGVPIGTPLEHKDKVRAVAYNPDGKTVLTGCQDGSARLWDAATGLSIGTPMVHQSGISAVDFSSDGKTVLTGSQDRTARLWNTETGKPTGPPLSHPATVSTVTFSPDGRMILTGSLDKTARLWDAATGQPIGKPLEHQGAVNAVAFSPDGKTVLTGSDDGKARMWETPAPLPVDLARLVVWIEALTGLELDEKGAIRVLDGAAWQQRRDRLSELGGPPPANFAQSLDPVLFGPEPTARARAWTKRNRWAEAESAFVEAVRAQPLNGDIRRESGQFYITRSQPGKAAANFREVALLDPNNLTTRYYQILTLAIARDRGELRQAISEVMERFGPWQAMANSVAWDCVLVPDAIADNAAAVRLAEVALKTWSGSVSFKAKALGTLGAALYRARRFDDAILRLEERIRLQNGESLPQDWVFLSLAHASLGHRDEARGWLDRFRSYRPNSDPNQFWEELEIQLLRDEAEAVVLYDPVFPADPFAH